MALNKVNIEFLRKQMDKVLDDIEKLKDANREIGYKATGVTHNDGSFIGTVGSYHVRSTKSSKVLLIKYELEM